MSLFTDINSENKVRISLTSFAMNTLQEDQANLGIGTATLLNRIIAGYSLSAKASLSVQLNACQTSLMNSLGPEYSEVMDKLIAAECEKLTSALPVYQEAKSSVLFRLSKANLFLLTSDASTHEELYYPKGIKKYLDALIEEFCRLPYLEREKYYCKDVLDTLLQAAKEGNAVCIFHSFGRKYLMKIYKIASDPLSTYSYVIAKAIAPDFPKIDGKIYSLRLSRIDKAVIRQDTDGSFTKAETKEIDKILMEDGVQFTGGYPVTITVRFTDKGLKKLSSQMNLRPKCIRIHSEDAHVRDFACTSLQARFYFSRFGAEALVLSPACLQEEMHKWYQEAEAAYSTMTAS